MVRGIQSKVRISVAWIVSNQTVVCMEQLDENIIQSEGLPPNVASNIKRI